MSAEEVWSRIREIADPILRLLSVPPVKIWWYVGGAIALFWIYKVARSSQRPSRVVIGLGTVIGLGWSAQGMWDVAVNTYGIAVQLASVLFCMFEAYLVGSMLEANHYRTDPVRRRPWVATVWTMAVVMALVVALGEGWTQAPLRLAVPLLVAMLWYRSLTADDDPAKRAKTSLRWTPRRLALWAGAIEPGERDERDINADRLRDRMVTLAFREKYAPEWLATATRTKIRRARLATDATDDDLAVVRARLARAEQVMGPVETPTPAKQPVEPERVPAPEPTPAAEPVTRPAPDRKVQGLHTRAGRTMRGSELKADAMEQVSAAELSGAPITNAELMALYDPPLGSRTAETYGAAARKLARQNGHQPV